MAEVQWEQSPTASRSGSNSPFPQNSLGGGMTMPYLVFVLAGSTQSAERAEPT